MIATSRPRARASALSNKNFDAVAKVLKAEQERTGIKLLWGTACLFANPRYMQQAPPQAATADALKPRPRRR